MLNSDLTYNCEYAPEHRVDSCHHKYYWSFSAASCGKHKSEEPKAIDPSLSTSRWGANAAPKVEFVNASVCHQVIM